ncbi:MAG: hypothetical protein M5U12_32775 [Verrucomicrobia bacterium]|nr:hypothetical protein [Verrucomicrobiota bacterium]
MYYAGGGGSGTFEYAHRSRSIVLEADLWRELSVMGNWIADATILRWAELTAEISDGALKPSQVVDHLLTVPIPEREVSAARSVYAALPTRRCVWTDRSLGGEFDVDHAIPFALWGNNDLWNLLPAAKDVNNQKRDRLPSRGLFQQRKECIVEYWSRLREAHVRRFEFEIGRLLTVGGAVGGNWEKRLFQRVAEAIEFTAIQRGVERWEPGERRSRAQRQASAARPASKGRPETRAEPGPDLFVLDPPPADRFLTCVPFYELEAAAGAFGPEQPAVDPGSHHTWIRVTGQSIAADMFSIRVKGQSMEPMIPDGACCLFRGGEALAGARQGRIVLVALREGADPETGGRLTVKRYSSDKVFDEEGGFRHVRIRLEPLNPEFQPVVLEAGEEGGVEGGGGVRRGHPRQAQADHGLNREPRARAVTHQCAVTMRPHVLSPTKAPGTMSGKVRRVRAQPRAGRKEEPTPVELRLWPRGLASSRALASAQGAGAGGAPGGRWRSHRRSGAGLAEHVEHRDSRARFGGSDAGTQGVGGHRERLGVHFAELHREPRPEGDGSAGGSHQGRVAVIVVSPDARGALEGGGGADRGIEVGARLQPTCGWGSEQPLHNLLASRGLTGQQESPDQFALAADSHSGEPLEHLPDGTSTSVESQSASRPSESAEMLRLATRSSR